MGKIVAVCVSEKRGEKKNDVGRAIVKKGYGIVGDGHAGSERQISLLAEESIEKMRRLGLNVGPGDFAENLTTQGIDLVSLPVGTKLKIGKKVLGEVIQIGKVCHDHCAIYKQVGDCVMPREGIFIKILNSGRVKRGDTICITKEE